MTRLKKGLLISFGTVLIIVILAILFISPIIKYLVQKYDEKYTGRQITVDWVYANPFTGYIHFSGLKIYEYKSDSIFFSTEGMSVNVSMRKLFSKTYELTGFTLNHPVGTVYQYKKVFNFNDLIEKFSSPVKVDSTAEPVHYTISNIKIIDGEFYYRDDQIPINYFIKKFNFESKGKRWDVDTIAAKFSFIPGIGGGDIKGDFTYNVKNSTYRSAVVVHHFDLNIIEQYMKDLSNYGTLTANLDANITAAGNITDEEDITIKGKMAVNDFHFGKNKSEDYASFDKLSVNILDLSPKNHQYVFDTIALIAPYFKYEKYDQLDNLENMFGKGGSNIAATKEDPTKFNLIIEIADYVKVLVKNFFKSEYLINKLEVSKGDIRYNDFSLSEKFALALNPLSIEGDSISKNYKHVALFLKSGIQPFGNLNMVLSLNPADTNEFDLKYHLEKVSVPMFNPYFIAYTSYPSDRGSIELNGNWEVKKGTINSDNHLIIIDPRFTQRLKNKANSWIPMKIAMAFIRERGNVIDYEIPITGDVKNPEFHLRDVLLDILKNIFVKPVTTSYRIEVKHLETEIEKSLTLKWKMREHSLTDTQEKFIDRMSDFLKKNPEASIVVRPEQYTIKEKEYILFFEAKKKYYMELNHKDAQSFSEEDSETVDKMSVKDSAFVRYLNKITNDPLAFTVQEKCKKLIGTALVDRKFQQLSLERENTFLTQFKEKNVSDRVKIAPAENKIPFRGFSFYRIEYKNEFPDALIKAYKKMNELDNEEPRSKFKKERWKGPTILKTG